MRCRFPPAAAHLPAAVNPAPPLTPLIWCSQAVVLADKLINGTTGTLSIDLKRPQLPRDDRARSSLFTTRRGPHRPTGFSFGGGRADAYGGGYAPPAPQGGYVDYGDLPSVAFGNTGARVKAMRHIQFGPTFDLVKDGTTTPTPAFDLGAGASFEFDTAALRPSARLKFRDALSLRLLPAPALRFQKRLQLGTSGFGVRLTYECPLEALPSFYAPPARLLVQLDNAVDTGVRLTQSGVEAAGTVRALGGAVRVRAAALVRLPSELPVDEDATLVGFELRRLGIKARW
jgi:hypothetical protein